MRVSDLGFRVKPGRKRFQWRLTEPGRFCTRSIPYPGRISTRKFSSQSTARDGSVCASHSLPLHPPWRQLRGKLMVSLVNFHTHATRIGWHPWGIDLIFAPGLPPGWRMNLFFGCTGLADAGGCMKSVYCQMRSCSPPPHTLGHALR